MKLREAQQYQTTYDLRAGTGAPAAMAGPSSFKLEKLIDFAVTPYAAADVLQLFYVPAGMVVVDVGYRLLVAEGSTCTIDLGDSASATQWKSNLNANGTAGTCESSASLGTPIAAKIYTAANDVRATLDHTTAHAVIAFFAWVRDCGVNYSARINPRLGVST